MSPLSKTDSLPSGHSRKGFSLVETVIALGIMGLAVTALLGLLPHGMEVSKKAADAGAMARIIDTVSTELSQLSTENLTALPAIQRLLFDNEGMLLLTSSSTSLVSYVAEVTKPTNTNGLVALPGGTADPNLLCFVVKVASTPLTDFRFELADPATFFTTPIFIGPSFP
jgi:uncharacterized protein (TIGR02598 family)